MQTSTERLLAAVQDHHAHVQDTLSFATEGSGWAFPIIAMVVVSAIVGILSIARAVRS